MLNRIMIGALLGFGSLTANPVFAHGGAAIEFDTCVVSLGKYTMHFTAYQQATGGEEHCWDVPSPGKTILVFDLVETVMRSKPAELRIVEMGKTGGIGGVVKTIAHVPTQVFPQGMIDVEASFEAEKKYIAVLVMSDVRPLVLKAPIQVVPKGTNAIYIGLGLAAIGGMVFFVLRRHRQAETA
ncbi:MAG: hypothetical protein M3436_06710 [Pseudomonadota bacterium]|nr:hypothetical protein [Pseudomonadota bacterium]